MDTLIAEDGNVFSLEEALAFIDGCDVHGQTLRETLVELVPMHNSPLDVLDPITPSEPQADVKMFPPAKQNVLDSFSSCDEKSTKKRKPNIFTSTSTRFEQSKREELQALREQAHELETVVEILKKNKTLQGNVVLELESNRLTGNDGALLMKRSAQKPHMNWHEMAITQYKERLASEKTNRRLKSIFANQEKVHATLSGLLQKRSVLKGMDYVLCTQDRIGDILLSSEFMPDEIVADNSKVVLMELEKRVQRRYKEFYPMPTQSEEISCDMRIKHDPQRGKMIEFVTSTLMTCSKDDASVTLWKELTKYRNYPDKTYKYTKGTKPNSFEKNFVMRVQSSSGMVELDGLQYMERFEELDRSVVIIADRLVLPNKATQFRGECWMTVTPSLTAPDTSVVDTFLQLFVECDDRLEKNSADIAYAQNILVRSLSNTFRKLLQALQDTLIEKAGHV